MNVRQFLTDTATAAPQAPAIITRAGSVTFSDLNERAHRLAVLLARHGIGPGMGLGLMARNGPEFLTGLFAGLEVGAVVMPLSHHLKEQELQRVTDVVQLAAILHDTSIRAPLPGTAVFQDGGLNLVVRASEFAAPVACGVPDAAVIRFTSGTTGTSKGVVLSHRAVEERTLAAIEALDLEPGGQVVWVLPMAYHFIVSVLAYVRAGVSLVLPDDSLPQAILDCAVTHYRDDKGLLLYASPLIVQMLSSDGSNKRFPRGTRVLSTSSGLSPETALAFEQRFGIPVRQLYGLIEVGLPLGSAKGACHPPGSVGSPLPGYDAAILDEDGHALPDNEVGKLAVRGPGMFDAYLAPYRPRSAVLTNGWFLTGDLAIRSPDGVIAVCGREKSVINSGGNKVFPEEIERVLDSFPGVRSSRAFGVPHAMLGEVAAAEIVPSHPETFELDALRRYCYERLTAYKVPKEIRLVRALPVTDSGKIVRAA